MTLGSEDVICGVAPKLHDFPPRTSLRALSIAQRVTDPPQEPTNTCCPRTTDTLEAKFVSSKCRIMMKWTWIRPRMCSSAPTMPAGKKEPQLICQLKLKIIFHGEFITQKYTKLLLIVLNRVEKYRPSSLDDVSGHQDILATINRFVDTNVLKQVQAA